MYTVLIYTVYIFILIGVPDGLRSHYPLIKSQVLYQLSYRHELVGMAGFEPA